MIIGQCSDPTIMYFESWVDPNNIMQELKVADMNVLRMIMTGEGLHGLQISEKGVLFVGSLK